MIEELRLVLCQLRRDSRFSIVCITCLAVGISVVVSVFSLLNEVLFRPLPFVDANRLVVLRAANLLQGRLDEDTSVADFLDWQEQSQSFDALAGYVLERIDLPLDSGFKRIYGFHASASFLDVLQQGPMMGTSFEPDDQFGDSSKIILSASLWRDYYNADPDLVGGIVRVNNWRDWPNTGTRGYALVGILPNGLRTFPSKTWMFKGGVNLHQELDFYRPLNIDQLSRSYRDLDVIGRLKDGVSWEQAQAEMQMIAKRLAAEHPENENWTVRVIPLREYVFGESKTLISCLFAAALFIMCIACGNVAHLMIVRFNKKQSDYAIQLSIGATPLRLFRQIFLESSLLVLMGSLLGALIASFSIGIMSDHVPEHLPLGDVQVNLNVLLFLFLSTLCCLVFICIVPLGRLFTVDLNQYLSMSGRTSSQGKSISRFSNYLVIGEFTGSYLLLVATTCLIVYLAKIGASDLGYDKENRLTLTVSLPQAKYEWQQNTLFCNEAIRRVKGIPGVKNAAAIKGLPEGGQAFASNLIVEGRPDLRKSDLPEPFIRVVTDDYFRVMGIPLLAGRFFNPSDSMGDIGQNRTILVNRTLAESCWPHQNPIGRRVKSWDQGHWLEVVGVVEDAKSAYTKETAADIYFPEKLFPQPRITLLVHTTVAPLSVAKSVRSTIRNIEPDVFITKLDSMEGVLAKSLAPVTYSLSLIFALAMAGLVLAVVGVLLTTAFSVSQRADELRIRTACGATPRDIIATVVQRSLSTTMFGLLFGLAVTMLIFSKQTFIDNPAWLPGILIIVFLVLSCASICSSLVVAIRNGVRVGSGN